jgi:hypothetical protein
MIPSGGCSTSVPAPRGAYNRGTVDPNDPNDPNDPTPDDALEVSAPTGGPHRSELESAATAIGLGLLLGTLLALIGRRSRGDRVD